MQKSISARLAALEALEARQETPDGVLHVFVQLRPTDYRDLVSGDDQAAAWVCATYGLDTIGEHERACVSGGTWPMSLPPNGLTVASFDVGEGYGSRVDRWPMYAAAPEPGAWAWHVAIGGDVEQMLREHMNRTLQTRLAALEAQPSGGAVYFVEWAEDDPLSYTVAGEHVTAETYQALLQQTDDRAKEIKVIYADWRDRARRANDRQA